MNYIRLSSLTNKYPQIGNYIPQSTGNATLFGIYEETNRIDFELRDFSEVIPIDGVSARFIFAVTYDESLSQIVDEDENVIDTKSDVTITPPTQSEDTTIDKFITQSKSTKRKKKKGLLGKIARVVAGAAAIAVLGPTSITVGTVAAAIKRKQIRKKAKPGLSSVLDRIKNKNKEIDLTTSTTTTPQTDKSNGIANRLIGRRNQRRDRIFGSNKSLENTSSNIAKPELIGDDGKPKLRIFSDLKISESDNIISKLFCSKEYFQNLTSAKLAGNPYFINFSFKPEFLVEINTIPLLELNDSFLEAELNNGVLMKRNNYITDGNIDFEKLIKYVDWVISKPQLSEIDSDNVIPANLLCEYEKGDFDKKTGKWSTSVDQKSNTTTDTDGGSSNNNSTSEYAPVGRAGTYTGEIAMVDGESYAWVTNKWRPTRADSGNNGGSNYGGYGGYGGSGEGSNPDRRGMR